MKQTRTLAAAGAVVAIAAAVLFFVCRTSGSGSSSGAGSADGGGGGSAGSGVGTGKVRAGTDTGPLRGFGQPGVAARRIAGIVVADGRPVAGAEVRLFSDLVVTGAEKRGVVRTAADGSFDFGPRAAADYLVSASAAGHAPSARSVDLRDPTAQPPSDKLVLRLWPCTATLYGVVRDASGGVVDGATVRVFSGLAEVVTITGTDGGYETCVRQGTGVARASADGYAQVAAEIDVRVNRLRQDFDLAPATTIAGRVLHAGDRSPVAGAHVTVNRADLRDPTSDYLGAISDDDGRFVVEGAAPGRYRLLAGTETSWGPSVEVLVTLGEKTEDVELLVYPAFAIRGTVKLAGTETPVAGVTVVAGAEYAEARDTAVSQTDGSFEIDGLPPGVYAMETHGHKLEAPELVTLEERDLEITVEVSALVTLRGRVTRGGQPIEDADVWSGDASDATEADGRFELRGVTPGDYEIHAQSDHDGAFAEAIAGHAEAGDVVEGIEIELDKASTIAGRVIDAAGAPVAGAAVTWVRDDEEDFGFAATATDGTFLARALAGSGTYTVEVRRTARHPRAMRPAKGEFPKVTVADGATHITGIELVVDTATGSISGRVVRKSGEPVADALVIAEGIFDAPLGRDWFDVDDQTTRSRADGTFTLGGLDPGDYNITARVGEGLDSQVEPVQLGAGGAATGVELVLPDTGAIDVTLVGFRAPPRVDAYLIGGGRSYGARVDGAHARIAEVGAGKYIVIATADASVAQAVVTVAPGKTAHAELTSSGSGTVAGRVIDFDTGAPVKNCTCGWKQSFTSTSVDPGEPFDTASPTGVHTDEDGRFRLDVPSGAVEIQCTNYASLWTDQVTISWPRITVAPSQTTPATAFQVRRTRTTPNVSDIYFGDMYGPPIVDNIFDRAETAGIHLGDLITAVGSKDVTRLHAMGVEYLIADLAGQPIPLRISRAGALLDITIPANPEAADDPYYDPSGQP